MTDEINPIMLMVKAIESLSTKVDGIALQAARTDTKINVITEASGLFRTEVRSEFRDVKEMVSDHAAEDTRRFESAALSLDKKVGEVYAHVDTQENERRRRTWQAAGVISGLIVGIASLAIAAIKAGWL